MFNIVYIFFTTFCCLCKKEFLINKTDLLKDLHFGPKRKTSNYFTFIPSMWKKTKRDFNVQIALTRVTLRCGHVVQEMLRYWIETSYLKFTLISWFISLWLYFFLQTHNTGNASPPNQLIPCQINSCEGITSNLGGTGDTFLPSFSVKIVRWRVTIYQLH